jgi:hypothetical protein
VIVHHSRNGLCVPQHATLLPTWPTNMCRIFAPGRQHYGVSARAHNRSDSSIFRVISECSGEFIVGKEFSNLCWIERGEVWSRSAHNPEQVRTVECVVALAGASNLFGEQMLRFEKRELWRRVCGVNGINIEKKDILGKPPSAAHPYIHSDLEVPDHSKLQS